jgi:hypothetical protein
VHEEIDQKRPGLNCLKDHIEAEIALADAFYSDADFDSAFRHLERAHVLGQSQTFDHTRIHWRMLTIGWKRRDAIEVFGQVIRVVGAATKTAFGIYPKGNTGGANVYFFKPMPIPQDLQAILDKTQTN